MNNIIIPKEVAFIINNLKEKLFDAYIVGGCVRDSILGKAPYDWDISTNAKPDDIKKLFDKTFDTGIKHGTVTVVINHKNFEVTTFRVDGEYLNNRKPENVQFVSSLEQDLARRDFTVNAIAYNMEKGLVDPFGGIKDIDEKIIRTVGNADDRFGEDSLRMLRAIRFSAQLGFEIEDSTLESIKNNSNLINNISKERIRDELTKTIASDNPERFVLFKETHLLDYILPEFLPCFQTEQNNPYHIYNVAIHTLKTVSSIRKDAVLRWVMLLHDIGKPQSKTTDEKGIDHFYNHPEKSVAISQKILKRLCFDNNSISKILTLVKYHDANIEPTPKAVRRALNKIGKAYFCDLLDVKQADKKGQNPKYLKGGLEKVCEIKSIFESITKNSECTSINELNIKGSDLIDLGIKEGKDIGKMLGILLERVIDDPALNDTEKLKSLATTIMFSNRANA